MMEMTLNVKITGLDNLVAVLERLAAVPQIVSVSTPVQAIPAQSAQANPVQAEPLQAVAAVVTSKTAPAMPAAQPCAPQPVAAVPVAAPPVIQASAVPVTVPQIAPAVPTTTRTYTSDDLSRAAAPLMDAGKAQELINLLKTFGVQAMTHLPPEQYGAFATQLRALGAKI